MAYDPIDHYVVLCCGVTNHYPGALGDTWTYAGGRWTDLNITGPPGRTLATMVWDDRDGYLVLFGGIDRSGNVLGDTWCFANGAWTNQTPGFGAAPSARDQAGMAYDAEDGYVVLFGGVPNLAGPVPFNDTWKFEGGVWTNLTRSVSGNPPGRFAMAMIYDAADSDVVEFGGCLTACSSGYAYDTWRYHNLSWQRELRLTSPSGRQYPGFAYDASLGYAVLFGGWGALGPSELQDTWKWANGSWINLTSTESTHPSARHGVAMAYDGFDGYLLFFGGRSDPPIPGNDTWAFGHTVLGPFFATPGTIDLGQSIELNATALSYAGFVRYSYSGLPPGCASANASNLVCRPAQVGGYNITVERNDSTGVPDTRNLTVFVRLDPIATSIVASPSILTVHSTFRVAVVAVDGISPYNFSYSGLPYDCRSVNESSIKCAPQRTGQFTISVTIRDAAGLTSNASTSVTVNPAPSVLSFIAQPSTIDLGMALVLSASATGGTGPLTYTYLGLPSGCYGVDLATLDCTPTESGTFVIEVRAADSFGWFANASVAVNVNIPPEILSFTISPERIDIGDSATIWLNATGGTGAIRLNYTGIPPGCDLGSMRTGPCTPNALGTFVVVGRALDALGIGTSSSSVLTVVSDPRLDDLTVLPSSVDAGQNVTIRAVASGGIAPYRFSYVGLPKGCIGLPGAVVTCRLAGAGPFVVVGTVTDSGRMSDRRSASITVFQDPTVVGFIPIGTTVQLGAAFDIKVNTSGGIAPFTFTYTGLPRGCSGMNRSDWSCRPAVAGTFDITVVVVDATGLRAVASGLIMVVSATWQRVGPDLSSSVQSLLLSGLAVAAVGVLASKLGRRRKVYPDSLEQGGIDELTSQPRVPA